VEREAKMEPPIQTEYLRSGGATIFTFMEAGAKALISFSMRSAIPSNIVVPPDKTMNGRKSEGIEPIGRKKTTKAQKCFTI
jgi:hypothetical protein